MRENSREMEWGVSNIIIKKVPSYSEDKKHPGDTYNEYL